MASREQLFNIIFIFMATAALGAILGMSVLRTVDTRLSDVSINIPPIRVPKTKVRVEWPDNLMQELKKELKLGEETHPFPQFQEETVPVGYGYDNTNADATVDVRGAPLLKQFGEGPVQSGGEAEGSTAEANRDILDSPEFRRTRDKTNNRNYYLATQQMESNRVSGYDPIHPHHGHRDIDHHSANRNHLGRPIRRVPGCEPHQFIMGEYRDQPCRPKQYYKDLSEMSERQVLKFKQNAKFDKMTVRDYVNWLSLYFQEPDILSQHNRRNLEKLKNGRRLTDDDIPRDENHPRSASALYDEMSLE